MFAEIDVSAWANGHYSLFARGHDSSGNWGAPRGTRLSVTGNAVRVILSDSFEEAGFESWSEAVGGVSTGFEAAMAPDGGTNGMQAVVEDGTPSYLSHQTLPGETSYAASFYFDPNGTAMSSEPHDILQGLSRGTGIFGIQCAAAGEGAEYQVRGWVQAGGVVLHTNWYGIADAPHKLGLDWKSTAGTFALMVDDVVVEELTELNIGTLRLYEMRLGPSANLDATMSGVEYFDRFEALRMIRVVLPLIVH
jgi:hypothetical protein